VGAEPGVGAQEAVRLGDVHPGQQVRVRGGVRPPVGRDPGDALVDRPDPRDRLPRVVGPAERRSGEKVTGPLQPAPRVAAVIRVLRHGGHGQRVQQLQQQGPDPANEHGRIPVNLADRPVLGEPALAGPVDLPPAGRARRSGDPLENGRANPRANPISSTQASHALIIGGHENRFAAGLAAPGPVPAALRITGRIRKCSQHSA
jgi:hypothetical protein